MNDNKNIIWMYIYYDNMNEQNKIKTVQNKLY